MYKNREGGNLLVVVIGIVLILFVIGFFNSSRSFWDTFNFKKILRLECGLTINTPKYDIEDKDEKIKYPLLVSGYINGCGWERNGDSAGTVQIFDSRGLQITKQSTLFIPSDSKQSPFFFQATLYPIAAPTQDTGTLLLTSTKGVLHQIPVRF